MTQIEAPTPANLLHSLRLIRSADPQERMSGVAGLGVARDDPRIVQVFEHLYKNDPDPSVREAAFRALHAVGPSIPAPIPEKAAPADSRISRPTRPDVPEHHQHLFLLNPANGPMVAKALRTRRRKPGGGTARTLAAALLLVIGVLVGLVLRDWATWLRLRQDGAATQGNVLTVQVRDDQHIVTYRYTVADLDYTREQRVTETVAGQYSAGDSIAVTYVADEPGIARLDEDDPALVQRDQLTIAAGLSAGGFALLLVLSAVQRRRSRRSPVIRGKVIACSGHEDADGDFHVKLRYQFRVPDGPVVKGQTTRLRNDLKNTQLPLAGTPVAVYYRGKKSHRLL